MYLSDLSIKRPVLATVMILSLMIMGIFSYRRLSVEMFPNVEIPAVSIVTRFPGASPEAVEREVSKPVEEAVNQIAGVKHVYSSSQDGVSIIEVECRLEERLNEAAQEIRAKISAIRGLLPEKAEEPIIRKMEVNAMPVISLAVHSDTMPDRELGTLVEKKIKRRFENIPGVGKVELVGIARREVKVLVDMVRLEAIGLGVNEVVAGLRAENVNSPIGNLTAGDREYPLRLMGKPVEVSPYGSICIAERNGRPVKLGEVASIVDGVEEQRSLSLVNGMHAVTLDIIKQSGANVVDVVDRARKVRDKLQTELPPGVRLEIVRDASVMTRDSLRDVQETLIIGGILTLIVVFCFINSW